jgi:hypothetical protein
MQVGVAAAVAVDLTWYVQSEGWFELGRSGLGDKQAHERVESFRRFGFNNFHSIDFWR